MYTLTETCYGETSTRNYERLRDAVKDACSSYDMENNGDGTNNVTASDITGPDGFHLDFEHIQDLARKAPRGGKRWELYWGYVARVLEQG